MPLFALGVNPIKAAAILLPILILQDLVSIAAYRRTWDGEVLTVMLPGAIIGVVLGWWFASAVSVELVLAAVGSVAILFGIYRLWVSFNGRVKAGRNWPQWTGALFGVASGFTSQIAHAGGPPFQMWVMPRMLPRDVFVGTTAIFFAAVNWIKVPAYVALGQFTAENLFATLTSGAARNRFKPARRAPGASRILGEIQHHCVRPFDRHRHQTDFRQHFLSVTSRQRQVAIWVCTNWFVCASIRVGRASVPAHFLRGQK